MNGESVCGALHSTVNEFGEMLAVVLTATKAHNQFMPVLAQISHSLRAYGHDDIQLVFTDNPRADRPELERAIPSLTRDVFPILPKNALPELTLPPDWVVYDLNTDYRIQSRINFILEDLQKLSVDESLELGMDMEWSVDRESNIHGKVAILSISYKKDIYLMHVSVLFLICYLLCLFISDADICIPERRTTSSASCTAYSSSSHSDQEAWCPCESGSHSSLP